MIRYAIYDPVNDGYVGHRTTCHYYSRELPPYMITKNLPCVSEKEARLFLRKHDAERMVNKLGLSFEIREFKCQPIVAT